MDLDTYRIQLSLRKEGRKQDWGINMGDFKFIFGISLFS